MSDLLSIGRSGVVAYRAALTAVGENVTNAQTDGYTRREVTLQESGVATSSSYQYRASAIFGGAQISNVQRVYDDYKSSAARLAISDAGRSDAKTQWLQTTETALNDSDVGLGVKLSGVFTSAESLGTDVNSETSRRTMLTSISDAVEQFHRTGAALKAAADGTATSARTTIDGLNGALKALAQVNIGLRRAANGTAASAQLLDQRDTLLKQISGAVGIDVQLQDDGRATVTLSGSGGLKLVDAQRPDTAFIGLLQSGDGRLSLVASGLTPETAIEPQTGSLSGLVDVSNTIASRRSDLDDIASRFATQINTWNKAGIDQNGNPGADLISNGTTALGMTVATSDLTKVAAASTDGVSNGNALALKNYRTSDGSEAHWALLVATHSQAVASSVSQQSATSGQRDGALLAVDEVTGVDLDVEAAQMLRFQQAYTASAKIIQVARETLQDILGLIQ